MSNFNIDHEREDRLGFPEIVFGTSKSTEDLILIINDYISRNKNILITKLQKKKAKRLLRHYPNSFYDTLSGIFMLKETSIVSENVKVAIISGGTSDIYIVNEVFYTLFFLGVKAEKINDVGVAGINRLMNRINDLKKYDILIVIAGFEGALPTVVGGLLPQPIIAVPTDVGYGVSKNGKTALNAMLSSCANGITVVNINNGYGAAMAAVRILNQFNK